MSHLMMNKFSSEQQINEELNRVEKELRSISHSLNMLKRGVPAPPTKERNSEIHAKRKQGRTLRSLAAEYKLSAERIRGIELREDRRLEFEALGVTKLSVRTHNCILNETGIDAHSSPSEAANAISAIGRRSLLRIPNFGKRTLDEVERWLSSQGLELPHDPITEETTKRYISFIEKQGYEVVPLKKQHL